MRSKAGAIILVIVALLFATAAVEIWRPDRAVRIGTGAASWLICTEHFVAGLPPERVFAEEIAPQRNLRHLASGLHYQIDREQHTVTTNWLGMFPSTAAWRDQRGCRVLAQGSKVLPPETAPPPVAPTKPEGAAAVDTAEAQPREASIIEPTSPALRAALDRAFTEPAAPPYRHTRAVVVVRDGHIVGERYADGIGIDTPLLGYSVSKSVTNALIGILVRQGQLMIGLQAPVKAWRDDKDSRQEITPNELLRMNSGLVSSEGLNGFDTASRLLFQEQDTAAFAAGAKLATVPAEHWAYSSTSTQILSGIIRNKAGGSADDVLRFMRSELLEPLGIRHMTVSFDAVDTPIGAAGMLAPAREWARFGLLYLDNGIARGRRILPNGWVDYSVRPTLDRDYGAGFWLNTTGKPEARRIVRPGIPADAFFASGLSGQHIAIIPSQGLVIARFGATVAEHDAVQEGMDQLIVDVIAATASNPAP